MKDLTEVLLDELLKDYQTPEQILGENGILKQLTKRLAERALQAEMTHHLGYAKHDYQSKANKETLAFGLVERASNKRRRELSTPYFLRT